MNRRALEKQQDQDTKYLSKLGSILQTDRFASHMDKDEHKRLLDNAFARKAYGKSQSAPVLMSESELDRDKEYQAWVTCETSRILLLSGHNWAGISSPTTLNWLSPAIDLVIDKYQDSDKLVAYHFCQATYRVKEGSAISFISVIASLIYQIISRQPHILRSGGLLQTIQDSFANEEDSELPSEAQDSVVDKLCNCLLKVLNSLDDGTEAMLVLDRIDECRLGREMLAPEVMMVGFARVVQAAKCVVKVFAIMDSSDEIRRISTRVGGKINKAYGVFYHRPNWDQESLRARKLNRMI
jgi:hypothetical protein